MVANKEFRPVSIESFPCLRVLSCPPRALAWLGLALFLTLPLAHAAGSSPAETGRLEGRVVIGPELSSRRMRFRVYADLRPGSPATGSRSATDELKNVVVYLESAPSASAVAAAQPRTLVIAQVNESFVPHVLPVFKGSTVEFTNQDPIFHNVFSLSKSRSFDLGRYPKGHSKTVRFDEPGIVKVFCHIHADMSSVVLVLDNPFFVVPDDEGNFSFDGISPGRYKVVAWHERAKRIVRSVEVRGGQTSTVNFAIPMEGVQARERPSSIPTGSDPVRPVPEGSRERTARVSSVRKEVRYAPGRTP